MENICQLPIYICENRCVKTAFLDIITFVAQFINVPHCLQITFTADDVVVPDVPGMFTSFQIKGVPLFVDPRLFDDPAHYARIMGYDKPINFKLSDFSGQKTKPTEKTDSA
jgi:hypothetical protein